MKKTELMGYIGMVLIHSATMPVTVRALFGQAVTLPPLSMVLMIWTGLALFLVRSVDNNDKLGIISNAAGFVMQSMMLAMIVF
jgi:hypothetical protein